MTNKKMRQMEPGAKTAPESGQEDNIPEGAAASVAETVVSPALDELQKQLAEAQSQTAEYKDGWQRAVADFQNYKRRVDAEKAETYQTAVGNIIKSYLPVLDDLERALTARPADLAWADGIDLICRKLQSILEAEGLKRIETEGQMFNPNFHEAISQEPSSGHESGQIIAVIRNGYMLGDKVIRPAMVRVAQ
jgi:molecular chaperone GrpE